MDPSDTAVVAALVDWLHARPDCRVEDGLDDAELTRAQTETTVNFPPVWRAVLRRAHPVPVGTIAYPDWRLRDSSARSLVDAPVAGVLFDVEHNGFWWPTWGERPAPTASAMTAAAAALKSVPRLVPLRGHWYTGNRDGTPVFSIVQTDLYLPARSVAALADAACPDVPSTSVEIPFWSELYARNQHL